MRKSFLEKLLAVGACLALALGVAWLSPVSEAATPVLAEVTAETTWDASADGDGSVTATYDTATKTLTVSGTGEMATYKKASLAPWMADYQTTIEKVVIEAGVENVGAYAFYQCTSLTSVTFNEGLEKIGQYSFNKLQATSIVIPSTVTTIAGNVFNGNGSTYILVDITILSPTISITSSAFTLGSNKITVKGHSGCEELTAYLSGKKAVFESICTYENGVCTGCGYECDHTFTDGVCSTCEYAGKDITQMNLALKESLVLKYYAVVADSVAGSYTPAMRFEMNDTNGVAYETVVAALPEQDEGRYVFELKEIAPQLMAETVTATLILLDGETVAEDGLDSYSGSVKEYLQALLAATTDETLTNLINATLNYGAQAQLYLGQENTITSDIEGFTAPNEALPEASEMVTNAGAEGETQIVGAGLWIDYTVMPYAYIYVKTGDEAALTVNGTEVPAEEFVFVQNSTEEAGAVYRVDLGGVAPTAYATGYSLALNGSTAEISINALCAATGGDFAVALYNYGVAAAAYNG